ncbi:hypothetical protein Y032_0007g3375 [Ancylostoma ceylanicum]|uniref:Uncharacterized protein n=1 Tax=Ancylostoma ceylanicum TaxID=53326 RepID=A0A016VM82_9BILA|nr:hypothetical protein Y032_0007g3375 [Ancylostoma ceylanicum]
MVTCHGCGQKYIGETGRPLHKRLDEHLRALWSPSSCPNNSFSHHGTLHHTYTRRSGLRYYTAHWKALWKRSCSWLWR